MKGVSKLSDKELNKEIIEEMPFRMVYFKEGSDKIGFRDFDKGSWKIVSISEIKDLS